MRLSVWYQDPAGFKARINQYLAVSEQHGIKTIFVLFDDCWHDNPELGVQPIPKPGIHNSGWVKGPGTKALKDKSQWGRLEEYVKDIVGSFGNDERIVIWDIYNEPKNNFLVSLKLPTMLRYIMMVGNLIKHRFVPSPTKQLLKQAFSWTREADPLQPLTAGLYFLLSLLAPISTTFVWN